MEPTSPTHVGEAQGERRFGRAPVEAADLAPERRPGVPAERSPRPWPNSRFPPAPMRAKPSVPKHGRPGKATPPVFSTAVPLRGLSGVIRKAAYRYPDHVATHWLLLLLGDRVDAWGTRASRIVKLVAPLAVVGLVVSRALGPRRGRVHPRR